MKLILQHPWFVWPTLKATRQAVLYSNAHFGSGHHTNTPANAFRHSIWNYLIANYCSRWDKNEEVVLFWATYITDLHELVLPGDALANAMDRHNNKVGRWVFKENKKATLSKGLSLLLGLTRASVQITTLEELKAIPNNQLVHLIAPE
jgi:hypothetical protein